MPSLAMSRAEREAFLAETHVGILAVAEPGRGPFAVPVWYVYEPGDDVRVVTGGASKKLPLLRAAGRATLCAQEETAPYRYVTVEGPIAIGRPDQQRDVRDTALRYLGPQMGEVYLGAMAAENATAVLVTLRPERWMTADFHKWRP
jgi:nitroimidazol reductase NimA-like FMN-containing flavoprotein (pyridoxamine 5'-phosphate oxidase superfamily)